ncbi:hypothetical protein Vafri_18584 [Volvox africanus]|uniref:Cyclin-like domain-containing protein n=1 Tax=Volvox africanus TaxID=51714 RepID=A0A8J4BMS6_9CHLO|nr:hypothetical protein Vafri_18584 [Volvox africanus]
MLDEARSCMDSDTAPLPPKGKETTSPGTAFQGHNGNSHEPRCPGTPKRPRELTTPSQYSNDSGTPVVKHDEESASISELPSNYLSATSAVAAAAGEISAMTLRADALANSARLAQQQQQQQQVFGSENGCYGVTSPSGQYHLSDAAQALRNMLARQRRVVAPVAFVPQLSPPSLGPSPRGTSSSGRLSISSLPPHHHPFPHHQQHQQDQQLRIQPQQEAQQQQQQQQELQDHQQQLHVRSVVVGWMAEVAAALRLSSATLSLAVELLDCYMSSQVRPPPHSMMQLLALTCLSVATRMEDTDHRFTVQDWASLALDRSRGILLYQEADFGRMEGLLLETLNWRTLQPTKYGILQHFLHCVETDPSVARQCAVPSSTSNSNAAAALKAVAVFLTELTLSCGELQRFQISTVAVACFAMALWLLSALHPGGSNAVDTVGAAGADSMMDVPAAPVAVGSGEAAAAAAAAVTAAADGAHLIVSALAAAAGVEEEILAPGLRPCFEMLEYLYGSAMWWVVRRNSQGDDEQAPMWLSEAILSRHVDVVSALLGGAQGVPLAGEPA